MRSSFLALIFLVAATPVVNSQQLTTTWLTDPERAHFESLRRSGLDALYNLDYDKAQRDFKEISHLYPFHPAGFQLQAARVWVKTLYESRRLQSSLYSSESFYTSGDDKVDPKIVEEFRALTRQARQLAEAKLKAEPRNIEALDFLATTQGLKASFEEAVERRHYAALRDGNDAVDHHREVLKLDPKFIDAQLTIGLYEYTVGSLPPLIKIVAGITGYRGSKKRGLSMIEQVAHEGKWSQDDAKTLLILLYSRERRYADALALTRELSAKYPRNYLFRLETADALIAIAKSKRIANDVAGATQDETEAFATFDQVLRDRAIKDTAIKAQDLIHFKYGEALLLAGQGERAAREFLLATKVQYAEPGLVTMAHLNAARAYDTAGQREDALAEYKEVLARPNVFNSHDEAKKGLR